MIGRGSPKILMEIASKVQQSRSSPKHGGKRKRRSPKVKSCRANWNPGLEKGLVQILLDHDNDRYRAQNGWKTEGWNLMYQKFCDQFPYVYKLYAGKTAEGKHAFISLEVKEDQHTTDDYVSIFEPSMDQHTTGVGSLAFLSSYSQHDDSDEEVRILHASTSSREKGPTTESSFKDKRPSASGVKVKKVGEKRKNSDIAEMMGSYIELKAKQTQVNVFSKKGLEKSLPVSPSRTAMLFWPP